MNANDQFEDDLALYAMRLLGEQETAAFAEDVAENPEAKQRLADVQAKLAAYAESSVELLPVPEGSFERLMKGIAQERNVVTLPVTERGGAVAARGEGSRKTGTLISWVGWAVAAMLALSTGKLYRDRSALHQHLTDEESAMTSERDRLRAEVSAQSNEAERLQTEASRAQSAAAGLQQAVAGQTAALNSVEQAAANAQHERDALRGRVAGQTATLNSVEQAAANAQRERDALRGTVAAQAGQVAQLAADQEGAQQILKALRDPAALRVTLKKPSAKTVPEGRATYQATKGTLLFLASNLAPLKVNKVYELWLMPADGSNPIPAGTFTPDAGGNASLIYAHFPSAVAAKGFSVTVEDSGGSSTPTLPIVLAGL